MILLHAHWAAVIPNYSSSLNTPYLYAFVTFFLQWTSFLFLLRNTYVYFRTQYKNSSSVAFPDPLSPHPCNSLHPWSLPSCAPWIIISYLWCRADHFIESKLCALLTLINSSQGRWLFQREHSVQVNAWLRDWILFLYVEGSGIWSFSGPYKAFQIGMAIYIFALR